MRLPTWDWLAAHDIHPSNSTTYYLSDIESALTQEYCETPYVGCAGPRYNETLTGANSTDGGYTQLSEVWYYFHVLGRPPERRLAAYKSDRIKFLCQNEGSDQLFRKSGWVRW